MMKRMFNWLVAGIGDITTKRAIPAILAEPRSHLHAVLTRDPAKAAPYGCKAYTSLEDALADPVIHAVYVGTPVALHAPQTIAALRAGKHVLCEKPMALNHADALAMAAAAHDTGRTLGIAYYRRMYPKVQRTKRLIEQGAIGKPVYCEANNHFWFNDEEGTRTWLLNPAMSGGGPLYDIASHRIDLFNFFFGSPTRATGFLANLVHKNAIEDCATAMIEYDSGVRAVIDVRWHSRIHRDQFRIIGTDGEISLDPLNGPELTYTGGSESLPRHENLHYPCVENFVDAVLDGKRLYASGDSSTPVSWVTEEVVKHHRVS